MEKQVKIETKEDIEFLKKLRKEENNHRLKNRIKNLILTR